MEALQVTGNGAVESKNSAAGAVEEDIPLAQIGRMSKPASFRKLMGQKDARCPDHESNNSCEHERIYESKRGLSLVIEWCECGANPTTSNGLQLKSSALHCPLKSKSRANYSFFRIERTPEA